MATEYKMKEDVTYGDDVYEKGETYLSLSDEFLENFEGCYEVIETRSRSIDPFSGVNDFN